MRVAVFASLCVFLTVPLQSPSAGENDTPQMQIQVSGLDDQEAETVFKQNASLPMRHEIHQTIEEQLRAIRDRNDRAAYNMSAMNIDNEYASAHEYMRSIRREKPSLYNHVHYEILPSSGNDKLQKVKLIDSHGKEALAMFKMQQDQNGHWRTGDIIILKTDEDPI